jgi:hypothetical protein
VSRRPHANAAAHLDEAQLDTVLDALDDAADHRTPGPRDACEDCKAEYGGLCFDHATDLLRADRYAAAARKLRQKSGRW